MFAMIALSPNLLHYADSFREIWELMSQPYQRTAKI